MSAYDKNADDFWDVSKLVPKKKPTATQFSSSVKTHSVEIGVAENVNGIPEADKRLNYDKLGSESVASSEKRPESYAPTGSRLVERVTIRPSVDKYFLWYALSQSISSAVSISGMIQLFSM